MPDLQHTDSSPAPILAQELTCHKVHKTIQGIQSKLQKEDAPISVQDISDELHVAAADLSTHINTLQNLNYIKLDRHNGYIHLTENGRYTVVPQ